MSSFWTLRHGQCSMNVHKVVGGWYDDDLTELGIQQAKEGIEFVLPLGITHILCSTLKRARHTAEIINSALNVPIEFTDDIKEKDYGPLCIGRKHADLSEAFGYDFRAYTRGKNWDLTHIGGESITIVVQRIRKAIEKVRLYTSEGKRVLVVTHSGVTRILHGIYDDNNGTIDIPVPHARPVEFDAEKIPDWNKFKF